MSPPGLRLLILSLALGAAACSNDAGLGGNGSPCSTSSQCSSGVCTTGACVGGAAADGGPSGGTDGAVAIHDDAGPTRTLVRVVVDPGTATLVSTDGARATQTFTAMVEYSDGTTQVATPRWTSSTLVAGDIGNGTGIFTANGFSGGVVRIRATVLQGATEIFGEATLTVRLERTVITAGTDPTAPTRFIGTAMIDPTRAADIAYPIDGAVMPQNVYPADIQWRNGAAGDIFRVRLSKPSVQVTAFVAYDGSNHWLADEPAWRRFAQTDPDVAATIEVTRWDAATQQLVDGRTISLKFARAALSGTIYYWDIAAGRIVRIDDGTATRNQFMPNPQEGCVGCHSVSASGRYMAGRFGGGENYGGVLDLTKDLTGAPPPTEYPANAGSIHWWFSSWAPDETPGRARMVVTLSLIHI